MLDTYIIHFKGWTQDEAGVKPERLFFATSAKLHPNILGYPMKIADNPLSADTLMMEIISFEASWDELHI